VCYGLRNVLAFAFVQVDFKSSFFSYSSLTINSLYIFSSSNFSRFHGTSYSSHPAAKICFETSLPRSKPSISRSREGHHFPSKAKVSDLLQKLCEAPFAGDQWIAVTNHGRLIVSHRIRIPKPVQSVRKSTVRGRYRIKSPPCRLASHSKHLSFF
jgi:hypothetical protein